MIIFPSTNNKIVFEEGDITALYGKSSASPVFCFETGAVFRISDEILKESPFNKSKKSSSFVNTDMLLNNLISK